MTLDWQFVVVTAVALGAAGVVVRRFVPSRRPATGPGARAATPVACEHCDAGARATATAAAPDGSSRTRTTPVVSVDDLRRSAKRH